VKKISVSAAFSRQPPERLAIPLLDRSLFVEKQPLACHTFNIERRRTGQSSNGSRQQEITKMTSIRNSRKAALVSIRRRAALKAWATIRRNAVSARQRKAAFKAWATIRANRRREAALKAWATIRANRVSARQRKAALKAWRTMRRAA
jgi:hypothetical protein